MAERKYSVREIDKMRHALMRRWWTAQTRLGLNEAHTFAERELRSYMEAGIDPDELDQSIPGYPAADA